MDYTKDTTTLHEEDGSLQSLQLNSETASRTTSKSRISFRKNPSNAELREPLTNDVEAANDPFYVFREDLYRKLDIVDEGLAEYLRIVHQTVEYSPLLWTVTQMTWPYPLSLSHTHYLVNCRTRQSIRTLSRTPRSSSSVI